MCQPISSARNRTGNKKDKKIPPLWSLVGETNNTQDESFNYFMHLTFLSAKEKHRSREGSREVLSQLSTWWSHWGGGGVGWGGGA